MNQGLETKTAHVGDFNPKNDFNYLWGDSTQGNSKCFTKMKDIKKMALKSKDNKNYSAV